jgi:hypothetical protein
MLALVMLITPRLTYGVIAFLISRFAPVRPCPEPGETDVMLALIAVCVMPYFVYLTLSVEPLLREANGRNGWWQRLSPVVENLQFISIFTPLWVKPLEDAFGPLPSLAAVVLWFVSSLSVLANVIAAAAWRSEQEGREPSSILLECFYNVGGAVGVYAARRTWPESKTIQSVAREPPYAFGFLVAAGIVCLAIKLTN